VSVIVDGFLLRAKVRKKGISCKYIQFLLFKTKNCGEKIFPPQLLLFSIFNFLLLRRYRLHFYLQAFLVVFDVLVEAFHFFFGRGDFGAGIAGEDVGFEPIGEVNLLKLFSPTEV
jgi:hypothetical protein